jgi:four helix bundle protein
MQDHTKLRVFAEAEALADEVYVIARALPIFERFGLASQLRRGACSIGSNIAEGCGRTGPRDVAQFFGISLGACRELEFQLRLSQRNELAPASLIAPTLVRALRLQRMLVRLIVRVRSAPS